MNRIPRLAAVVAVLLAVLVAAPPAAVAQDDDGPITGKAILAHPIGKVAIETAKLLRAGKLGEVRMKSAKEARDEWATLSAAEKKESTEMSQERAPDPKGLADQIAKTGELYVMETFARLSVPSDDGNVTVMAFFALEGGTWRATAGPMNVDTAPIVESEPPIEGAAILEHAIGKLALAYSKQIAAGKLDAAAAMSTTAAQEKRTKLPADERKAHDKYLIENIPAPAALEAQIRSGGRLSMQGEKAYLNVTVNTQTKNADGSVTYSSTATGMGFAMENGVWRVAD